jgi:hypothetical protein
MKIKTLTLVFACAVGVSFGLLGVPRASAITFNFNVPSSPPPLGTTQDYGSAPFNVTAAGFSSAAQLATGVPNVNLFGKNLPGDESGLGLVNDPSGENEITGASLIRIAMGAGLTAPVTFTMDSATTGETWLVSGSNLATSGFAPLMSGTDEMVSHTIPFFNFYTFQATVGNVLLASMTAAAVPGPIIGSGLPGLVVACGALIALARRRCRQRIARS